MKSKCCNADVFVKEKSNNNCVYCTRCGKFVKNANKNELREIEHSQSKNDVVVPIDEKYTIVLMELQNLINKIKKEIAYETGILSKSKIDAIRKSAKMYELERIKISLYNILDGTPIS